MCLTSLCGLCEVLKWLLRCNVGNAQEIDRAWARRHEWGAVRVYSMMLDLSGYYVKAAQIIASKGDFIPKEWIPHLSLMFDAMPPRPWPCIAKVRPLSLLSSQESCLSLSLCIAKVRALSLLSSQESCLSQPS